MFVYKVIIETFYIYALHKRVFEKAIMHKDTDCYLLCFTFENVFEVLAFMENVRYDSLVTKSVLVTRKRRKL